MVATIHRRDDAGTRAPCINIMHSVLSEKNHKENREETRADRQGRPRITCTHAREITRFDDGKTREHREIDAGGKSITR